MENTNLLIVFVEGVISFLSPCILPILPIYIGILSNSSVKSLKEGKVKFTSTSLFKNTILFVLGISTTFFLLGSSINALKGFLSEYRNILTLIGGIIIIIMGIFYMGYLKIPFLQKEKRFKYSTKEMNPISAYILGLTFSFGWTPCIGPMLTSILIMASSYESSIKGNLLIFIYTLGFTLPFILMSVFFDKLFGVLDKIKKHMNLIQKIGGIILICSGLIVAVGGMDSIGEYINKSNDQSIEESNEKPSEDTTKLKALDFNFYDQYGNEHKLDDYKGKVIFLNFWATWCPPCRQEMPYIEKLYNEYKEKGADVAILGVASPNVGKEGNEEYIKEFLNKEGYTFPVLFDEGGKLSMQYGISALPTTFIIDKEGYVKGYIPGAMNESTMKKIIDGELNS